MSLANKNPAIARGVLSAATACCLVPVDAQDERELVRVLEVRISLEVDHAAFEEQLALVTQRQRRAATSVVAPAVVPAALDHHRLWRGRRGFGRVADVLSADVSGAAHCVETEVREARA